VITKRIPVLTYDPAHKMKVGEVVRINGGVCIDLQRVDIITTVKQLVNQIN
jgi:hypothetical protein